MNLLCPTCQKQLQVPEQYAGQMMKCPLCSATFTVPVLPQMPAVTPPPPPTMPSPQQFTASPPAPRTAPPLETPGGQPHFGALTINPRLVPWLAPLSLLAIFVLMFFSWVGMFPGGVGVLTQTGWQVPFGSTSVDERWNGYATREKYWERYYGTDIEPLKAPGMSIFLVFFVLVVVPATLAALVSLVLSLKLLPIEVPAGLAPFWPMRSLFVGGLSLAALVFLVMAMWSGFPLEVKVSDQVKAAVATDRERAPTGEKSDPQRWEIETGIRLGGFVLGRTLWFTLAVVFNVLAVIGAGLELWLERRGEQALPRIALTG